MDNTNNNKNNIKTTNHVGTANVINHLGNNSGISNDQFSNPNYGVPNKAGYAYIPHQPATGAISPSSDVTQPITKKRHGVVTVLLVVVLMAVSLFVFLYESGLLPWKSRAQRSEYAYLLYQTLDSLGKGTIAQDVRATNGDLKVAMNEELEDFFDSMETEINSAKLLFTYYPDEEAMRLVGKLEDEVYKWYQYDQDRVVDITAEMQAEIDGLSPDWAVYYWSARASSELVSEVQALTSAGGDEVFRTKCELFDYLTDVMSQSRRGQYLLTDVTSDPVCDKYLPEYTGSEQGWRCMIMLAGLLGDFCEKKNSAQKRLPLLFS